MLFNFFNFLFFTHHSYFLCLCLVIQWYLQCASLTRTLSLGHSEKQPGLLCQWYHPQLWLSPGALFTYSATVCDSIDNYLLAMAGCITCCVQCTIRLGTFLKILVQPPKVALWLGKCFGLCNVLGLGLHQNRFSQWSILISQQIREWLSSDRFKNRLDHHLPLMLLT